MEVKGKSESALFRHLGEEFSDLKNKSRIVLREHLKALAVFGRSPAQIFKTGGQIHGIRNFRTSSLRSSFYSFNWR